MLLSSGISFKWSIVENTSYCLILTLLHAVNSSLNEDHWSIEIVMETIKKILIALFLNVKE